MNNMSEIQKSYVDGLKAMADFLEKNPHLIPEYTGLTVNNFYETSGELVANAVGGKWDKDATGSFYCLDKSFGPHKVSLNVRRTNVCEQVEVGEETVTIPDPDAPMVTVTRPVYEWKCPESILEMSL